MFDLNFDLSWRGASGLRGRGRGVAFALARFASFSRLRFRSFGLWVHLRVICSVDFTSLHFLFVSYLVYPRGKTSHVTSLFNKVQTIDGCNSSCYFLLASLLLFSASIFYFGSCVGMRRSEEPRRAPSSNSGTFACENTHKVSLSPVCRTQVLCENMFAAAT
jgi:hypothetical protein